MTEMANVSLMVPRAPRRSDNAPEARRPSILKRASKETTAAALAGVKPIICCAMGDAWEIIIMPANAPQVSVSSMK